MELSGDCKTVHESPPAGPDAQRSRDRAGRRDWSSGAGDLAAAWKQHRPSVPLFATRDFIQTTKAVHYFLERERGPYLTTSSIPYGQIWRHGPLLNQTVVNF